MKKIYPSASGFALESGAYEIKYNSACLRFLVVSQGIKSVIPDDNAKIGAIHEDWWFSQLTEQEKWKREVPFKVPYGDDLEYSGRTDFIMGETGPVHETKATMSKNALYKTIRKKEPQLGHLAQLVSYMAHLQREEGAIIVGFYKKDEKKDTFELKEYYKFTVKINDDGVITVDDVPYQYTATNYALFLRLQIEALDKEKIMNRPMRMKAWEDPCKFCPLRQTCDKFDTSTEQNKEDTFKQEAKTILTKETV